MSQPLLSVVLPCYNEAEGVAEILRRFKEAGQGVEFELILVDNGSTDNTAEVMAELLPSYPFAGCVRIAENKGYGDGVFTGLREARGEVLAWSHADLQTDPADVFRALDLYRRMPDPQRLLVKGIRHGRRLSERVVSWGMKVAALVLLRRWMTEINAQPKLFHRDLLERISHPPVDFNFDVYVLYRARRFGWRFAGVHVRFPPRQYGQSNWAATWRSKVRTILRSIRFMFRLGAGLWP